MAKYNDLQVDVGKGFAVGTTNSSPECIAKYGANQVPFFEGTDGTIIFESGAIAHYRKSDRTRVASILIKYAINITSLPPY